jgi:hypothetical protein
MTIRTTRLLAFIAMTLPLTGCLVGPDYQRPAPVSPPPAHYTELPGWATAAPADAAPKGDWWTDFHDPLLDQLEPAVRISNQTVRADYENYQQALALVREADAALFPTIGATGSVTRSRSGGGSGVSAVSGQSHSIVNQGSIEGTLSWDLDIWGKLRRTIEENVANAQASEATLANATLSEQVTLATTVINLRVTDANIDLLTRTVEEYKESLRVVSNGVKAGYSLYPPSDEINARTQLENAQANLIALGRRSRSACRRPCFSAVPTSPPPNGRWRRRTRLSASRSQPTIPIFRFPRRMASRSRRSAAFCAPPTMFGPSAQRVRRRYSISAPAKRKSMPPRRPIARPSQPIAARS